MKKKVRFVFEKKDDEKLLRNYGKFLKRTEARHLPKATYEGNLFLLMELAKKKRIDSEQKLKEWKEAYEKGRISRDFYLKGLKILKDNSLGREISRRIREEVKASEEELEAERKKLIEEIDSVDNEIKYSKNCKMKRKKM